MRRARPLWLALALAAAGCPSAYDRTYQQETQRLEAEEAARQAQQQAEQQEAYQEAARHAAVVYFAVGSAVIGEEGYRELGWFAQQIRNAPPAHLLVQGFADATGGETANQELSRERAVAVARYLESLGIAHERLVVQGFSENFPAADNATAPGRRNNRRVEVTLR